MVPQLADYADANPPYMLLPNGTLSVAGTMPRASRGRGAALCHNWPSAAISLVESDIRVMAARCTYSHVRNGLPEATLLR